MTLVVPLSVAFGNPDLLEQSVSGPVLAGLGGERQYKNDEQIDDSLRSVLFQVPKPTTTDPSACLEPVVTAPASPASRIWAPIDIARGRDHGMPSYNQMRAAYGLAHRTSFTHHGEHRPLPVDPNEPGDLDFTALRDVSGNPVPLGTPEAQEDAVTGIRRDEPRGAAEGGLRRQSAVDAFIGMVSEPHMAGSDFGPLQQAMWKKQFESTARRRSLLLPQRPGAAGDPAAVRDQRPALAGPDHPRRHRRGGAGRRVRGPCRVAPEKRPQPTPSRERASVRPCGPAPAGRWAGS